MNLLEKLGYQVMIGLDHFGKMVILFWKTLTQFKNMSSSLLFQQMAHLGVDSLPIVTLTLVFAGAVMTLQIADVLTTYGAQSTVGGIISIAMGRELGPVLVAVVLSGRVGAAITAEIGAMKVTEQIDALRVMAVDPIGYLIVPRLFACVLMVPILAFYGVFLGVLGGYIVATQVSGVPGPVFIESIEVMVVSTDLIFGLIKASVFGAVIAMVGCYKGLHTKVGAAGVGQATTSSVVTSIIIIFVLNFFLSSLLF